MWVSVVGGQLVPRYVISRGRFVVAIVGLAFRLRRGGTRSGSRNRPTIQRLLIRALRRCRRRRWRWGSGCGSGSLLGVSGAGTWHSRVHDRLRCLWTGQGWRKGGPGCMSGGISESPIGVWIVVDGCD